MNEHLLPVFEVIFPKLREVNLSFWVHGGIAVAAIKGDYLRRNKDIDIFVEDKDFEKTKKILECLCYENLMSLEEKDQKLKFTMAEMKFFH